MSTPGGMGTQGGTIPTFVQGLGHSSLGELWRPGSNRHRNCQKARWPGQRGLVRGLKRGKLPVGLLLVPSEQQLESLGQPRRLSAHSQGGVSFPASMREAAHSYPASVSPFVRGGTCSVAA